MSTDLEVSPRGRRMQDQLQTSLLVFTIVSLVFTGGYNWRRVDELTKAVDDAKKDTETYVRKDVLAEQFKTLNQQLIALAGQLEDVKTALREQKR